MCSRDYSVACPQGRLRFYNDFLSPFLCYRSQTGLMWATVRRARCSIFECGRACRARFVCEASEAYTGCIFHSCRLHEAHLRYECFQAIAHQLFPTVCCCFLARPHLQLALALLSIFVRFSYTARKTQCCFQVACVPQEVASALLLFFVASGQVRN